MKSIFKYEVQIEGMFNISMPKGAEIIAFQTQHGNPCIWAIVDKETKHTTRCFAIHGTGHDFMTPGRYIGTIQADNGMFVWHLFEIVEDEEKE